MIDKKYYFFIDAEAKEGVFSHLFIGKSIIMMLKILLSQENKTLFA